MSFNFKALQNLGGHSGSSGQPNLWLYTTPDTVETVQSAGYFDEAVECGLKHYDAMLVAAEIDSLATVNYLVKVSISEEPPIVILTELDPIS